MRALILHPLHASKSKPADAGEFRREATGFGASLADAGWDVTQQSFDNQLPKPLRRASVERVIAGGDGLWDLIAMFGHGLKTGIQTGHDMAGIPALADLLDAHAAPHVRVELYACDAARDSDRDKRDDVRDAVGGDGGFADALRDALSVRGKRGHVDAHTTTAHTTKNPHVRRFHMDGEARGTGGDWLVAPGSPKWRAWRAALRGPMRFAFPLLTQAEIDAAL